MPHEFLDAWRRFDSSATPFLLEEDRAALLSPKAEKCRAAHGSWRDLVADPDFGAADGRLHLSLIPKPFFGNIDSAPVVILSLNPGLNPIDYYAEVHCPEYRQALLANLRNERTSDEFPNLFLDPAFSFHSGFKYWHGKLSALIDDVKKREGESRRVVLSRFARSVAMLELLPYHSEQFRVPAGLMNRLKSVELARMFAKDILIPAARKSEKLIIVARGRFWEIRKEKSVIVYRGSEARGFSLTPNSPGGKAILQFFGGSR